MSILETDGAETAFTFKDSQANAPAPDSEFVFHPPAGIPVVDGPASGIGGVGYQGCVRTRD